MLLLTIVALTAVPASASAHGALDPAGSDYLARITSAPRGLDIRVVDGDLRLWLRAPRAAHVLVLDPQGAPYLRFSPGGIDVNENSELFYFNQSPPTTPPNGQGRVARADWARVGGGHTYEWHEPRLGVGAEVAAQPGRTYVGAWRVPLVVDGRFTAVAGALYHHPPPSIVWFWPVVVLVACALALWRLPGARLHLQLARTLAGLVLAATLVGAVARGLHGRPGVSGFSVFVMLVVVGLALLALVRLLRGDAGLLTFLLVLAVGLWVGITLIPALSHGYVLLAVPALPARLAAVLCFGGSLALVPLFWRLDELADRGGGQPTPSERLVRSAA